MHSSFPRFSIFFSAMVRRIWVLSIGIWLCTHWFHTQKWKIMRSSGLRGAEWERNAQVWLLLWVCISSVICHTKHRLFAPFFSNTSRWIKPAGIVINWAFNGTKVVIIYTAYKLRNEKKKRDSKHVCYIQDHKMAELFLHQNAAEVFVSIIDCLRGNNTKTKANGGKKLF